MAAWAMVHGTIFAHREALALARNMDVSRGWRIGLWRRHLFHSKRSDGLTKSTSSHATFRQEVVSVSGLSQGPIWSCCELDTAITFAAIVT